MKSETSSSQEYLLGVNQTELDRLRFQHSVWGGVTRAFLDRIKIQNGWKCLDVGAGPGFVSMDLRECVGDTGEVTALEPSEMYLNWFKNEVNRRAWKNVKCVQGTAETTQLPSRYFDLVFVRWVIAFVSEPVKFLDGLIKTLKPGGIIALQDYWYEGLSFYPRGSILERLPDIVRAYYRSGGGDPYVTGEIPTILRRRDLKIIDYSPHQLTGGPESGVMEWVHRFFVGHLPLMVQKGVISQEEMDEILRVWLAFRNNPDAIYFSPIVVDIAGELPR